MKRRTFQRLMQLECYAYDRWRRSIMLSGRDSFWLHLARACNRAVKDHPDYRGVR